MQKLSVNEFAKYIQNRRDLYEAVQRNGIFKKENFDLRRVKVKAQDAEMIDYLLLLRFGPKETAILETPILNYASIAKATKLPYRTVIDLVKCARSSARTTSPILSAPTPSLSGRTPR